MDKLKFLDIFFDKLEDKIRGRLSKYPIVYAFIGSIGIVLLWRGIWYFADEFDFMTPLISTVLGVAILLAIGLFVSFFVGEQIIISGLRSEKKTDEKTAIEIQREAISLQDIREDIDAMRIKIEEMHDEIALLTKKKTLSKKASINKEEVITVNE